MHRHISYADHLTLNRDSSILPEELATQSVRLKEEQLRREEEKVYILSRFNNVVISDAISLLAARNRAQSAA